VTDLFMKSIALRSHLLLTVWP